MKLDLTTDTETIEHLDFAPEIPCIKPVLRSTDIRYCVPEDHAAEWLVVLSCGDTFGVCTRALARYDPALAYYCRICATSGVLPVDRIAL